ncbi:KRI1-like family C-terminal-domain-containing protein [Aspergillus coremiiformis]|uniref:KRI1-like family C-terminal-domain-containing protein n=1 Tax=Aspergillus coremiiformis TaxID=138285 RepID=A0A5N6YV98_9EURO|nr:KRI1-like family C-terminal-domain-containing protein [Aspergillus coremiiformis]
MEPPAKKSRKLFDKDISSDSGDESGGVPVNSEVTLKVNEDYARRFEHNKKREELQKLESKLGKDAAFGRRGDDGDGDSDESSSEDEDDDGELATQALDAEIMATIKAIRTKDPRVYNKDVTFYSHIDEDGQPVTSEKNQKPMTLKDYHRENLLSGVNLVEEDTGAPRTYAQEQEDLKNAIVKEMNAAADNVDSSTDKESDDDGDFLVAKPAPESASAPQKDVKLDIENADQDPETFLSNFLSSRAWIPADKAEFHPLESDDDEDDERAEAFEEAYNFRFEDPSKINATLITHARDATNQQSVRREDKSSRKKHRESERSKKEEEKKQRETEKNRLRKLKMEELQEKLNQIKEVAGLHASKYTDEEWANFLDDAWDDQKWEQEMQKRFGEEYYAGEGNGKKNPKKPTWDDDIDIKDLVPDFEDDEKPDVQQSNIEMDDADDAEGDESASKNTKSKAQERRDQKREARKDRLRIEEAIDRNLDLDINLLPGAFKKHQGEFRYRETSPNSFGLTARDILMADDAQLNEYAGLKKLASFRDAEKKRRDQKKLGKKARLRQWRKDTFGNEDGPEFVFGGERTAGEKDDASDAGKVDIREGEPRRKKRKRSKKH